MTGSPDRTNVALELVPGGLATAPTAGGAPAGERGPVAPAELPALLRQLVRPEFGQDVIIPQVGDAMLGAPACEVSGCGRPGGAARGMCGGHYLRWRNAGKPEMSTWVSQPALCCRGVASR